MFFLPRVRSLLKCIDEGSTVERKGCSGRLENIHILTFFVKTFKLKKKVKNTRLSKRNILVTEVRKSDLSNYLSKDSK